MSISARLNSITSPRLFLRQPLQSGISLLHQLWWRSKGYGAIFGVMLLALLSLGVLYLAEQFRRLKAHHNDSETKFKQVKLQSASISNLQDNKSF